MGLGWWWLPPHRCPPLIMQTGCFPERREGDFREYLTHSVAQQVRPLAFVFVQQNATEVLVAHGQSAFERELPIRVEEVTVAGAAVRK